MKKLFDDINDINELEAKFLEELASIPSARGTDPKAMRRHESAEEEINKQYNAARRRILTNRGSKDA